MGTKRGKSWPERAFQLSPSEESPHEFKLGPSASARVFCRRSNVFFKHLDFAIDPNIHVSPRVGGDSRVSGQEWAILAPTDGEVLEGDVRCVPVYLRKPAGGQAILRVTYLNEKGGVASNLPIGPGQYEIVSLHQDGEKLSTGDYRLEIYVDDQLDQLKAKADFRIEANDDPINLPSLDSPISGHRYPSGIPKIRFVGKSSCRIYLGIKKSLKPVFIVAVDPKPNLIWEVDIPWSYGPGVYTVDVFLFDPSAFRQVAEDGATFEVMQGKDQSNTLQWRSYNSMR